MWSRSRVDELRGDRDLAGWPAGFGVGPALGAALQAAVLVDGAVVGVRLPRCAPRGSR